MTKVVYFFKAINAIIKNNRSDALFQSNRHLKNTYSKSIALVYVKQNGI